MKSNLLTLFHLGFCCLLWNWMFQRVLRLVNSLYKRPNWNCRPQTPRRQKGLDPGLVLIFLSLVYFPKFPAGELCKVPDLCISMIFDQLPVLWTHVLLSMCDNDFVDLRYEEESDGAKAQGAEQEDTKEVLSQWCCSQTRYSCLRVVTVVGLLYMCIQYRVFVGKQGVVQVVRMNLSCLPLAGLMNLM